MLGVGVDFGTSNSAIAWYDGTQVRCVPLEGTHVILPTAFHLSRDYVGTVGTAAITLYVEENSARLVHMVPEIVGHAASEIGFADNDVDKGELESARNLIFGPLIDHGLPGRLFLGLKRLLGSSQIDRLVVFRRAYRLVALLTPILQRMRECVEQDVHQRVPRTHIGRPVNFEGREPGRNRLALTRLREACQHAGFNEIEFYAEPVAATLSFLQASGVAEGTVLTVDFGGGTLDLSVLHCAGTRIRVLGTAGADLGGDRIDQLIFRRLLFPLLGEGETWTRFVDGHLVETPFPFNEYEEGILNWAITHTLNQNKYKTRLAALIARGGPAAAKFERLQDLINFNYSYTIFSAIKKAKAALSTVEHTTIDLPELNLNVPFSRDQLDDMLTPMMQRLSELVAVVLADACIEPAKLDYVVRTGGSSQIVAVRTLLEAQFPGKVTEHDPFTSVAAGLAIASYHELSLAMSS